MCKPFLALLFSVLVSVPAVASTEGAELDQALRQLEAAKSALYRAQKSAMQSRSSQVSVTERFYFDYPKARQEIDLIKQGITRYLNNDRAQPRDPRQIRTLSGEYDKTRATQ